MRKTSARIAEGMANGSCRGMSERLPGDSHVSPNGHRPSDPEVHSRNSLSFPLSITFNQYIVIVTPHFQRQVAQIHDTLRSNIFVFWGEVEEGVVTAKSKTVEGGATTLRSPITLRIMVVLAASCKQSFHPLSAVARRVLRAMSCTLPCHDIMSLLFQHLRSEAKCQNFQSGERQREDG